MLYNEQVGYYNNNSVRLKKGHLFGIAFHYVYKRSGMHVSKH